MFSGRTRITETGCHEWTGVKVGKGYGQMSYEGKKRRAHRLAFELAFGSPLSMHVLHKCDNPACVRPDHLFLGTNAQNVADKMAKGRHRAAKGEKQGHAKLTDEQARLILLDTRMQKDIAIDYGVSRGTICMLKKRATWRHL